MKTLIRAVLVAVVAASLTLTSAFAGECCKKAADKTAAGKSCSKCESHKCCKNAAAKVEKDGKAKACAKCSKAGKEEKKS